MHERRLHHVGFVVGSIPESLGGFARWMGVSADPVIYHDPVQRVRVAFLASAVPGEAQIELVEPASPDSPVQRFLASSGGLHHLCYEVDDLDAHMREMRASGCRLVRPPVPAVAFAGRRIGWMLTQQNLLLEFLERHGPRQSS